MRTTVNVRDDLLRRAKKTALEHASTLNEVFEIALTEFLARLEKSQPIEPVDLPRSKQTGGVQPGIDLNDTASLIDVLEGRA